MGLHANVSRLLYFGEPSKEISDKYEAPCNIHASIVCNLKPGMLFSEMFECVKKQYAKFGYPKEWRNHFQGAIIGYILADSIIFLSNKAKVKAKQVFDWFITRKFQSTKTI